VNERMLQRGKKKWAEGQKEEQSRWHMFKGIVYIHGKEGTSSMAGILVREAGRSNLLKMPS
jgi:hypothetical protein